MLKSPIGPAKPSRVNSALMFSRVTKWAMARRSWRHEIGSALIAPAPDALRQRVAGQRFAAFVERDDGRPRRNHSFQRCCFFSNTIAGAASTALVDFTDRDSADADRAPGFGRALAIALGKIALRSALETADRGNNQPHLN